MNKEQLQQMHEGKGFIAALDQSGGSTPKALALYGVPETAYSTEEEMFTLVHEMRTRIVTNEHFKGDRIVGAILFQATMERKVEGLPTAQYLWEKKHVVPFLKIDKGLLPENENHVRLLKDMPELDALLDEANGYGIFGTKERSVILAANEEGIKQVVAQQFEVARRVIAKGLVPIIEPEVDINIKDKAEAEELLLKYLLLEGKKLSADEKVMYKLSIPTKADLYRPLEDLPSTVRVVALSGGYSQEDANKLLKKNHGMIASFSRALSEGLQKSMSDEEFSREIGKSIDAIYDASVNKD